MRFFIIDDSGSMATRDALRIIQRSDNVFLEEKVTRWQELVETIQFHSQLANSAKCKTEFRFLNNSDPITVGGPQDDRSNHPKLLAALNLPPKFMTPLCKSIKAVIQTIQLMATDLRRTGKKVKVIIASDGEASDGNLADAMRPLRDLPVWIVVRLCTSNETISKYWADIDAELELNMDVIQNHVFEAEEINTVNPWLVYSEPLHRLRETGLTFKEADLLDEIRLTHEQILNVCILIFGSQYKDTFPHPDIDRQGFLRALQTACDEVPRVMHPITKKLATHIDIAVLKKCLAGVNCGCIVH